MFFFHTLWSSITIPPGFPETLSEDLRVIVEEEQKNAEDEQEARNKQMSWAVARSTSVGWWLVGGFYYPSYIGEYNSPRTGNPYKPTRNYQPGFQGLRCVSVPLSTPSNAFSCDELGLIRAAQNGNTNDTLIHSGKVADAQCKFCQGNDSVHHRHWECPATQSSRDSIPPATLHIIASMAPCLQQHALTPEPVEVRWFKASLAEIPPTMFLSVPMRLPQDHVDYLLWWHR